VSPDEVSRCETSRCEPVATAGKENFSLWLKEPGVPAPRFITAWVDEPWPEFDAKRHYDVRQPSKLQAVLLTSSKSRAAGSHLIEAES
jgi:hypothetical protein